ncbi:OpcA, an allosteric effector of glucose-6-phosphate dehydrogenase, cyanobacterial [Minicystis rosea]|nr:OpcA, an allosteric effector of glucose-6-phosphate dehydrogenase, cyanobacterial [Minicystis rosea]
MTTGAVSETVSKVEAELSAFWASQADDRGHPKARAATMNFIAVSVPAEVDRLRAAVEDLAQTRAGRAFLATLDGRLEPWSIESAVSAVCHKEGDSIVCYDRIELHFGAGAAQRATSVISALSLSEVPTIVEIGRSAPTPLVDALVKVADRIIVDSAHTSAVRIAEIAGKTSAPLGDRAFVRTFSWREFIARFFDEAPGAERAIGRIEIERTPSDRGDPAALILGWLAARLGWRFESKSRAVDAQGMPIEIVVRAPHGKDLHAGELSAVHITTAIDNRPLFCEVGRDDGGRCVSWTMSGPRAAHHKHPLGFRDEGWVLLKAIDATEGDGVYRAAVMAAAEWAKDAER